MNCLLKALAMSLGLMCVLFLNVIELLSCCGGRLCARRVLCSSRCLCFVCDPMVFRCVPFRYMSCLWRSLCLTPVYWNLGACFCLPSFCVLF